MNASKDMGKECWASGCDREPQHLTLLNQTMVSLCKEHNENLNDNDSETEESS